MDRLPSRRIAPAAAVVALGLAMLPDGSGRPAIGQRADDAEPELTILSGGLRSIADIAPVAPDDLWLAGVGGLAHFDGRDWSVVEHRLGDAFAVEVVGRDGMALARSGTLVMRNGNWASGPPRESLVDIEMRSAEVVWGIRDQGDGEIEVGQVRAAGFDRAATLRGTYVAMDSLSDDAVWVLTTDRLSLIRDRVVVRSIPVAEELVARDLEMISEDEGLLVGGTCTNGGVQRGTIGDFHGDGVAVTLRVPFSAGFTRVVHQNGRYLVVGNNRSSFLFGPGLDFAPLSLGESDFCNSVYQAMAIGADGVYAAGHDPGSVYVDRIADGARTSVMRPEHRPGGAPSTNGGVISMTYGSIVERSAVGSRELYRLAETTNAHLNEVLVRGEAIDVVGSSGLWVSRRDGVWRERRLPGKYNLHHLVSDGRDVFAAGSRPLGDGIGFPSSQYAILQLDEDGSEVVLDGGTEDATRGWLDIELIPGGFWILKIDEVVRAMADGTRSSHRLPDGMRWAQRFVKAADGRLFVASKEQVLIFDGSTWTVDEGFLALDAEIRDGLEVHDMAGDNAGNVWLAGSRGTILRRRLDGVWRDHSTRSLPMAPKGTLSFWNLTDLGVVDDGERHALSIIGDNNTIFRIDYTAPPLPGRAPTLVATTDWRGVHEVYLPSLELPGLRAH